MTFAQRAVLWFVVTAGIAAVIGAVVIGSLHRDAEVEEEPYEAGLRFDRDRGMLDDLGWRTRGIKVMTGEGSADMALDLRDRDGNRVNIKTGGVDALATRPAGDLSDVPCPVEPSGEGLITATCSPLAMGHWELVFNISTDSGPLKLTERVYVKERSD